MDKTARRRIPGFDEPYCDAVEHHERLDAQPGILANKSSPPVRQAYNAIRR